LQSFDEFRTTIDASCKIEASKDSQQII